MQLILNNSTKLFGRCWQHSCFAICLLATSICYANQGIPDAEQPLNIDASQVEFDDQQGIAIYTDKVIARQGSRSLTADKLIMQRGQDNQLKLLIATGMPAHFQAQPKLTEPRLYGSADTIKHFPTKNKVHLIGNARIEQGGKIITGHILIYFFQTGLLKSKPAKQQRTTVILPQQNKNL